MERMYQSLDCAVVALAAEVMERGQKVSPRNEETVEVGPIGFSILNPRKRYISIKARKWSMPLAIGEFCWHLSGSDKVSAISYYAPRWESFSDDGAVISGSCYGRKIFGSEDGSKSDWERIIQLLKYDPDTRRAILFFDKGNDRFLPETKDVSCVSSMQFLLRNSSVDAIVQMRSNDLIWGLPYDVFLFSLIQELLALTLGLEVGVYYHIANSLHVYKRHYELARSLSNAKVLLEQEMPPMDSLSELPRFLEGERAIREGRAVGPFQSTYWNDFAEVLKGFRSSTFDQSSFNWSGYNKLLT